MAEKSNAQRLPSVTKHQRGREDKPILLELLRSGRLLHVILEDNQIPRPSPTRGRVDLIHLGHNENFVVGRSRSLGRSVSQL